MWITTTLTQVVPGFENGELIAIALFGGTGVVAVWWAAVNFRDGYEIWSHEPVDAAAVRHESGVVEVSGTAAPLRDTVTAPYSDEDCLAYEYQRKERRDDIGDDNRSEWRTVDSGDDSVPFLVEDGSGRVPVDPDGADISMNERDHSSSTRTKKNESRLDAGETVHVFGHKRTDGGTVPADEPFHIGDGGEINYRIADTTGSRAVARLFAKAAGAALFGAAFLGVAGFVLTNGFP